MDSQVGARKTVSDRVVGVPVARRDAFARRLVRRIAAHRALVATVVGVALLWEISTFVFPPIIVPSIPKVVYAVVAILSDYEQLRNLLYTGARVLVGMALAFIFGTALGLLMGTARHVREYSKPVLHLLQGIPALSWVVFAVIWFSQVEVRVIFILTIVTLPSFALYTDSAVRAVRKELVDVARALRATRMQRFRMVILPSITPEVLGSWSVNLGNGVRAAVVAELIGATVGVGYQLLQAQAVYNMAAAIAWTLMLVAMLTVFQAIVSLIERRLLSYRPTDEAS